MIKNSKGCFWELDSPMWGEIMGDGTKPPGNPSLCHPWSSGVTAWLSHHTLGVTALTPGHGQWLAAPAVSAQLREVAGDVPTATDPIRVQARWQEEEVAVVVEASTPGRVGVMRSHSAEASTSRLIGATVDGVEVAASTIATPTAAVVEGGALLSALSAAQVEERWFTELLPPGRHTVVARYTVDASVAPPPPPSETDAEESPGARSRHAPFPPAEFPVKTSNDTTTHGTGWLDKYGSSGWVLYGFDDGNTRTKLPPFVNNITFSLGAGHVAGPAVLCTASDERCLEDPADKTKRSLGGVSWPLQVIDINSTLGTSYKLAIYCVADAAPPAKGKPPPVAIPAHPPQHALRIMDLSPGAGHLNPVATTINFHNFSSGVWWVLEADRPLRIRMQGMYGASAISALAFSV